MNLPKSSLMAQSSTRLPSLYTPATTSGVSRVILTSDQLAINLELLKQLSSDDIFFLKRYTELNSSAILTIVIV